MYLQMTTRLNARLLTAALLLFVFWLGARDLSRDSFWYDEYWSLFDAGGASFGPKTPVEVWTSLAERNPWQSPGYFLALNLWGGLVGWSEEAGRALSLLVGLLAVAIVYRSGAEIGGYWAGVAAAGALGASAYYVHYMTEMRAYTFYALFTALAFWAYWRSLLAPDRRADWKTWLTLFAAAVGLLYTHYFAALTLVVLGVVHLGVGFIGMIAPRRGLINWGLPRRASRAWWTVVGIMALAGVTFLPWLGVVIEATGRMIEGEDRQGLALTSTQIVNNMFELFGNRNTTLLIVAGVFALVPLFVRVSRIRVRRARGLAPLQTDVERARLGVGTRLVWAWLILFFAVALGLNAVLRAVSEERYLMGMVPIMALLFGIGVAQFRTTAGLPAVLIVVWIGVGAAAAGDPEYRNARLHPPFWYMPYRETAEALEVWGQPGDQVLIHLSDRTWSWMHERIADYYLRALPVENSIIVNLREMTDAEYRDQFDTLVLETPRIWSAAKANGMSTRLTQFDAVTQGLGAVNCGEVGTHGDLRLWLYIHAPLTVDEAPLRFGDTVGLDVVGGVGQPRAGALHVALAWVLRRNTPRDTYSYALHLTDASGTLVAQTDAGLPNESRACTPVTLAVGALAPGDYTLSALVYAWQTGERLTGADGDHAVIGTIRVPEA